jgi:hypothetical protein
MQELKKQITLAHPFHNFPLNFPRENVSTNRSAVSMHRGSSDNTYVHPSRNLVDNENHNGNNTPNNKPKRKTLIIPDPVKEEMKYKPTPRVNTFDYGLKFQITRFICYYGSKKSEQYKTYYALNNYLNERMDLRYYLHSLQKNDRMRTVLFNYYQNLSFDFMKSPNVCSAAELEEMDLMLYRNTDENFNELIHYFKERRANGTMDGYDKQLFQMLRQDVKENVNDNS